MTYYDLSQTIELLERAVAEKGPDYIYDPGKDEHGDRNMCRYVNQDGKPACIVGQVLSYVGLLGEFTYFTEGMARSQPVIRDNFTEEAQVALRDAQRLQDKGETWGMALAAAKGIES